MTNKSKTYWACAMTFLSFFLSWSFAYSLFPLWLNQSLGLSGQKIGLIFGANACAVLLSMPVFGILQDKLGVKKSLLIGLSVLTVFVGPFFVFIYQPLLSSYFIGGVVIGAIYSALAFGGAVGTLEAFIERIGRQQLIEFGKTRFWGSIGWAFAMFAAGSLFNISPSINFWLSSCFGACLLACLLWLPQPISESKTPDTTNVKMGDIAALFKQKSFWRMCVFVTGVSCLYQIFDQQFAIYYASFFDTTQNGNRYYGYVSSFQVFLEAGMMFLAPLLVNRMGAKNGLLVSGFVMSLRILGAGMAADPVSISVIKLLHAIELPLLLVSMFKYIITVFDERLSATIYLVGFGVFTQVIVMSLSSYVGHFYDQFGFANTYLVLGSIVLLNVCLSSQLLESTPPKNVKMTPVQST
ncbi:MFS transporter [Alteromonas sp. I4]|nr:MFS transporter [Alteromonas sp. I4]